MVSRTTRDARCALGGLAAGVLLAIAAPVAAAPITIPLKTDGRIPLSGGYELRVDQTEVGNFPYVQLTVADAIGRTTERTKVTLEGFRGLTAPQLNPNGNPTQFPLSELQQMQQRGDQPKLTVTVGDQALVSSQPVQLADRPPTVEPPAQQKPQPRPSFLQQLTPQPGGGPSQQSPSPGGGGGGAPPGDGGGGGSGGGGGTLVPCTGDRPCKLPELVKLGQNIFNFLMSVGAIAAVAAIVVAGFQYVTSQGDPGRMAEAKKNLMWAIVGLLVLLITVVLVNSILLALQYRTTSELQTTPNLPGLPTLK